MSDREQLIKQNELLYATNLKLTKYKVNVNKARREIKKLIEDRPEDSDVRFGLQMALETLEESIEEGD